MRPAVLIGMAIIVAVCAFQLWVAPDNPPGFFRDEAAIAYNAYTIGHDGRPVRVPDEWRQMLPQWPDAE